jgi:hypothetical protein
MAKSKITNAQKAQLLDYYKEPNTEIALAHLHQLKDYFFRILDELTTNSVLAKSNSMVQFRGDLDDIIGLLTKISIINFPYEFSKETYLSILGNVDKSLQNARTLWDKCEEMKRNEARKKLVEIQNPVELALDFTIELIVELENSIKNKKTA